MRALGASRTSLVPGGVLAGPWVRDDLWRRARAVPSLDLRFADNKSLVDAVTGASLVTFTRASSGTFVDSAGVLQTAATDVPRFDHNPITGESLGLLIEEQRRNSVVNSNSMTGVVTGSPGTLPTGWSAQGNAGGWTREVVGSGSIGSLNYVDIRFSGTPTGGTFSVTFQGQGVVAASNGQSWSPSVYHQLVGGAISNITGFPAANLWNSTPSFIGGLSVSGTIVPTSTLQRFTGSDTIGLATTAFISWGITFTCTIGNTYDFTIRFAGPQLELGAFSTSYIPTTTAAATRAADVASISGSNFSSWYRQDQGTFYSDTNLLTGVTSTNRFVFEVNDGVPVTGDKWDLRRTGGSAYRTQIRDGGASNSDQTISTSANPLRIAVAADSSAVFTSANGAATSSAAKFPAGFTTVDRLFIGGGIDVSTLQTNGTIKRLIFWPELFSNLQALSQ